MNLLCTLTRVFKREMLAGLTLPEVKVSDPNINITVIIDHIEELSTMIAVFWFVDRVSGHIHHIGNNI